jgi:hypothetical protein
MRNFIMFIGLRSVVEDSALLWRNTSLNILFGVFRRNGLPLSSRIQKSATKLRLTEREIFCGVFFDDVPPSSKITGFYLLHERRGSVISVLRLLVPGFESWQRQKTFYRHHSVQTGSGTTHLPSCNGYDVSFVGLERPEPHVDDWSSFSANVKMNWAIPLHPLHAFLACQRTNFPFSMRNT